MNLSKETPRAFLACGEDDRPDIAQGLPELCFALKRAGVSTELHVYAGVGHGFGVRESNGPPVSVGHRSSSSGFCVLCLRENKFTKLPIWKSLWQPDL